ncbi:hypothetical protein BDR26DRAFT_242952 [Obelidium mucronatum]|nr:hypothetical protein BDR26DRAFT_242952 [Obelidium mucronatum]
MRPTHEFSWILSIFFGGANFCVFATINKSSWKICICSSINQAGEINATLFSIKCIFHCGIVNLLLFVLSLEFQGLIKLCYAQYANDKFIVEWFDCSTRAEELGVQFHF